MVFKIINNNEPNSCSHFLTEKYCIFIQAEEIISFVLIILVKGHNLILD